MLWPQQFQVIPLTHQQDQEYGTIIHHLGIHMSLLNFAQLDVTSTVGQPLVNVGVGDCSSASWTSSSSITCQQNSDENQKLAHEHIVQIASRIGTSLPIFSMDSPVVSHVMHNAPYVGHTLLTYMGLQFGGYNFTLTSALAAGATATNHSLDNLINCGLRLQSSIRCDQNCLNHSLCICVHWTANLHV